MNTENDKARLVAERIARQVSAGGMISRGAARPTGQLTAEIASVRTTISELQTRLTQLESQAREEQRTNTGSSAETTFVPPTHSPWLAGVNATPAHASEERFGIEEAVVSELVDYFQNEKACSLDPSGKPCDHCAMCSSRGF